MATGCLSVPRIPDDPRHRAVRGRAPPHGPLAARGRRLRRQARRRDRHRLVRRAGDPRDRGAGRAPDGVPADGELQRPGVERPLDAEAISERKARYGVLRTLARTTSAGNPWNTRSQSVWDATPEEREREFEERYAVGGFCLHAAYRDLFQDPAANDLLCEFLRDEDPRARARPRARRAALPLRPPARHQADVRGHRLLRDVQPRQRPSGLDPRDADRRDHRDTACASARSSSRSTRSCSAPASTR